MSPIVMTHVMMTSVVVTPIVMTSVVMTSVVMKIVVMKIVLMPAEMPIIVISMVVVVVRPPAANSYSTRRWAHTGLPPPAPAAAIQVVAPAVERLVGGGEEASLGQDSPIHAGNHARCV
jgi:hypothetical protein